MTYPHFHIVTIHISTFCGNVVDNPVFFAFFVHKYAVSAVFFPSTNGGIFINKYVIHIFINIFSLV